MFNLQYYYIRLILHLNNKIKTVRILSQSMSKYIIFGQKYHKGEKKFETPGPIKRLKRFLPPGRRSKLKQLIKNK